MTKITEEQVRFLQDISEKTEKIETLGKEKGYDAWATFTFGGVETFVGKVKIGTEDIVSGCVLGLFDHKEKVYDFFNRAAEVLQRDRKEVIMELYQKKIESL